MDILQVRSLINRTKPAEKDGRGSGNDRGAVSTFVYLEESEGIQ